MNMEKKKKVIFYKIHSESMIPTLNPRDIVICGEKAPEDIKIGDIIVVNQEFFRNGGYDDLFLQRYKGYPVIHRVVHKEKRDGKFFFKTRGDNNTTMDTGFKVLERTEDYVLVEYDPLSPTLIPESEIMGVVLKKISTLCPKCGNKIQDNLAFNPETERSLDVFGNFKKVDFKFYFDKDKRKK